RAHPRRRGAGHADAFAHDPGRAKQRSQDRSPVMLSWLWSDPLPVGSKAPAFTLQDESGNAVSLAGLHGKNVVLVFYPGDDTSVCTKQLCEFRDRWEQAKAKNTVVYGVNPWSAASHMK